PLPTRTHSRCRSSNTRTVTAREKGQVEDPMEDKLTGMVKLTTSREQFVQSLCVKLVEKYTRGRGKNRKSTEFELGQVVVAVHQMILPGVPFFVEFEMDFEELQSEMDEIQDRGGIKGRLAQLAKRINNVESVYRVEAEAYVEGTNVNPWSKSELVM
ncbi:MAG: hypothetical protein AAF705_22785, partial [Bacteroidota bacterium]